MGLDKDGQGRMMRQVDLVYPVTGPELCSRAFTVKVGLAYSHQSNLPADPLNCFGYVALLLRAANVEIYQLLILCHRVRILLLSLCSPPEEVQNIIGHAIEGREPYVEEILNRVYSLGLYFIVRFYNRRGSWRMLAQEYAWSLLNLLINGRKKSLDINTETVTP